MTYPNFFIPGVAKAGTTSLSKYLASHPDVFMSELKEPHYFSRINPARQLEAFYVHIDDEADYLKLFRKAAAAKVVGEASSSYFWDVEAPRRIAAIRPDAQFVILLRNPIERAFSHYLNDVREGIEQRTFGEAVAEESAEDKSPRCWGVDTLYLSCSFYYDSLYRYLDVFGRDQVLVLVFEEFADKPLEALRQICRFLEIDARGVTEIPLQVHNPFAMPRGRLVQVLFGTATGRRLGRLWPRWVRARMRRLLLKPAEKPPLKASVRRHLAELFRNDVERCNRLLGWELPWNLGH